MKWVETKWASGRTKNISNLFLSDLTTIKAFVKLVVIKIKDENGTENEEPEALHASSSFPYIVVAFVIICDLIYI